MKTHHNKKDLYKWIDGALKTAPIPIELSETFEADFWKKVYARQEELWFIKLLREIESHIPTPSFAQAFAVLLIALLIGGTGGAVSVMNTITPQKIETQQTSIKYLSGFQEFKGIPSSSVAASYLKAVEERRPK